MSLQVIRNSAKEDFHTKMTAEHTNDRTPFQIADRVEDLTDFKGIFYRNLDGV